MSHDDRNLADEFTLHVEAGVPGMLMESSQHEDALTEIRNVCMSPENQWILAVWDLDRGMVRYESRGDGKFAKSVSWYKQVPKTVDEPDGNGGIHARRVVTYELQDGVQVDPALVLKGMPGMNLTQFGDGETHVPAILVMLNHHRWLSKPGMIQHMANLLWENRLVNRHVVLLSPEMKLPVELEKLFEGGQIRHKLPDRKQLGEIVAGWGEEALPAAGVEPVIDSIAGLTQLGAEGVCAMSMALTNTLVPKTMFRFKADAFLKSHPAVELYQGDLSFKDYGGASNLKNVIKQSAMRRETNPKLRSRGVFVVGPPGVGKSYLAQCAGDEVGRPTLELHLSRTKGSLVGETGKAFRSMLEVAESMSPNICFIDELDKALASSAGSQSSGDPTSGETLGELLSWQGGRMKGDCFVIAAANDIRPILDNKPEAVRTGRYDGMFFLDFPDRAAKDAIWKIQLAIYDLIDPTGDVEKQFAELDLPEDSHWTAAEIEGCCKKSRIRGQSLQQAGSTIPTVDKMAHETLEAIRNWADGVCEAAEYDGVYTKKDHAHILQEIAETNGVAAPRRAVRKSRKKSAA